MTCTMASAMLNGKHSFKSMIVIILPLRLSTDMYNEANKNTMPRDLVST